jgi:hypothetical protein
MKFFLALLAGAAVAALPVVASGAAPDASQTPCTGVLATDAAKDESVAPTPLVADPLRRNGADSYADIRSFYFTHRKNEAGKLVLTAHIAVTNLSKTVPDLAGPVAETVWQATFNEFEEVYSLQARSDGTDVTFTYGTYAPPVPPSPVALVAEKETTGKFTEGPDGVVSIDWPADVPIPAGTKLEGVGANTHYDRINEDTFVLIPIDKAPDKDVKTYTVTECPSAEATPTNTTTTTNPTDGQNGQNGQQQPAQQPQPAPMQAPQQQQGPLAPGTPLPLAGKLSFDVAVDKGKRKTARKRGLRARMRCSVQCRVRATAKVSKKVARKLKLHRRKAVTIAKGKGSIKTAGRKTFYVKLTKRAKRALKRAGVKKFALKVTFRVTDTQGKQVKKVTRKSTLR